MRYSSIVLMVLGLVSFTQATKLQSRSAPALDNLGDDEEQVAAQVSTFLVFGDGQHLSQSQERLLSQLTDQVYTQLQRAQVSTSSRYEGEVASFILAELADPASGLWAEITEQALNPGRVAAEVSVEGWLDTLKNFFKKKNTTAQAAVQTLANDRQFLVQTASLILANQEEDAPVKKPNKFLQFLKAKAGALIQQKLQALKGGQSAVEVESAVESLSEEELTQHVAHFVLAEALSRGVLSGLEGTVGYTFTRAENGQESEDDHPAKLNLKQRIRQAIKNLAGKGLTVLNNQVDKIQSKIGNEALNNFLDAKQAKINEQINAKLDGDDNDQDETVAAAAAQVESVVRSRIGRY